MMSEDEKSTSLILSKGLDCLGYSDVCIQYKRASQHLIQSTQCQKPGTEVIVTRQGEGMTGFKIFAWVRSNSDIQVTYINSMFKVEDGGGKVKGKPKAVALNMDTKDVPPGYVRLKFATTIKTAVPGDPLMKYFPYFGSTTFCQILEDAASGQDLLGRYRGFYHPGHSNVTLIKDEERPDYSVTKDFDHALILKKWPKQALKWQIRKRVDWPSKKMVTTIVESGCYIMPKGHPVSSTKHLEWRIVFSTAEMTLLDSLNETQRKCYALLKIILQDLLKPLAPGCLAPYHMKTLLFWMAESTERTLWTEENLVLCFHLCILKLRSWISDEFIPHYIIEENNLIEGRIDDEKKQKLIDKLNDILQHIWESLSECESFRYIHDPLFELKQVDVLENLARWFLLVELSAVDKECTTSISLMRWKMQCQSVNSVNTEKAIQNLQAIKADILKHTRREGITASFLTEPLIALYENRIGTLKYGLYMSKKRKKGKEHEMQFNEAAGLLKKTMNMDLSLGPLTMAAFHISNKDYKKAEALIQQVIEVKDVLIYLDRIVPRGYSAAEEIATALFHKDPTTFLDVAPCWGAELQKLYSRFLTGFHPDKQKQCVQELGHMATHPSWLCGCLVLDIQFMTLDYSWVPLAVQFEVMARPWSDSGNLENPSVQLNMQNLIFDKPTSEGVSLVVVTFHPLIFAYYLKFVCLLHFGEEGKCEQVLRDMETACKRVSYKYHTSSYSLLGWCYKQVGNIYMASSCFLKSLMVCSTGNHAAIWHLGIIMTSETCLKILKAQCP